MTKRIHSCPLSQTQALDRYFLEHRAKLIDIAAFIDRIDRTTPTADQPCDKDFRLVAFGSALTILTDDQPHRAKRVLELLSDPTRTPATDAATKGAVGAYPGPPTGSDQTD